MMSASFIVGSAVFQVFQKFTLILIVRLQRLLPLKRALTEVEHDVKDTHHAMEEVSPNGLFK